MTKHIPLFILFIFSTGYTAQIKSEKNGNTEKIYLDYNNDKKSDAIETFTKGVLVKKEQDLNFDGIFDETTEYFPYTSEKRPFEVITKKDRILKVYRNENLNKFITTAEVDTNGDGKFDKFFTTSEVIDQKRDNPCKEPQSSIAPLFDSLSRAVNQSVAKLDSDYITLDIGYKVQKSCLDKWGDQTFPRLLTKTISTGMSCLEKLAKKNTERDPKKSNGALTNAFNLKRLLKNSPVTIICNENRNWDGIAGHASSSLDTRIKTQPNVQHPFLSLSPKYPEKKMRPTNEETSEISRTIFHEQLHNLGIRHGEGVEYPYTCESCCISQKDQRPEEKRIACKICGGQYDMENKKDKLSYLKDMLVFGEVSYNYNLSKTAVKNFQSENPGDQAAAFLAARSYSSVFSATGLEMAKLLKQKFPIRSKDDNENYIKALDYQLEKHLKLVASQAKTIAQANIDYFYDNDPGKSMDTLEKDKENLKKIIINANKINQPDAEKWTNEALLHDTKTILDEIFLKGYPDHQDKASSDRAYALIQELKL